MAELPQRRISTILGGQLVRGEVRSKLVRTSLSDGGHSSGSWGGGVRAIRRSIDFESAAAQHGEQQRANRVIVLDYENPFLPRHPESSLPRTPIACSPQNKKEQALCPLSLEDAADVRRARPPQGMS